jgi:hypothetical protein
MTRLATAIDQIQRVRGYTSTLIDTVPEADWFQMPNEGGSHVAWQVGHIAAAQWFLTMKRIRGPRPEDTELLPPEYGELFGKGSQPVADQSKYPEPAAIRATFDRVFLQAIEELTPRDESLMDEPSDPPHPAFSTKGGALQFAPLHEMLHAGQIGLLRRLYGAKPMEWG